MAKKNKSVVVGVGIECHRCGQATDLMEHPEITAKQLNRPFYYSQWYRCRNTSCPTTLIMPEAHKVWNKNSAASMLREQDDLFMLRNF